jgi:hypothetical protein
MRGAGLKNTALYLIRPDGCVASQTRMRAERLRQYFATHLCELRLPSLHKVEHNLRTSQRLWNDTDGTGIDTNGATRRAIRLNRPSLKRSSSSSSTETELERTTTVCALELSIADGALNRLPPIDTIGIS